jgi:hypothetical protein
VGPLGPSSLPQPDVRYHDDILRLVCTFQLRYGFRVSLLASVSSILFSQPSNHQQQLLITVGVQGLFGKCHYFVVFFWPRIEWAFEVRVDAFQDLGFGSQISLVLGLVEHGRSF